MDEFWDTPALPNSGGLHRSRSIRSPRWPADRADQHPEGTHAGAGDDARPGAHDDPGWADLLVNVANQSTKTCGVLARQFALDPERLARRRFGGRVGDGDRANHQTGDDQAP